ncbi:mandelate racemase/muconate lactonizing enzyme family protein [Pseudaquabacterium rugosum]|uniref:Mandelate racemase/muconate lactonizing enzyme family protein n=1 Tax=Pseudaquabacterium rugosum TaxID=2984194 RepID=A0ABU9BF52_9BURK
MKIVSVEPIVLSIPFEDGGQGTGMTPTRWHRLDMVLVKIVTDRGLIGWGEAFAYFCRRAVAAQVRDLYAPMLIGQPLEPTTDLSALNLQLQQRSCLFGRYGVSTFALSGIDIALWDLQAKAAGCDLATLIAGRRRRETVAAYASLVRYGEAAQVARHCERAQREGYTSIKLHEVTLPEIRAGRAAMDRTSTFTVDVNCSWDEAFAARAIPELIALDTLWLEEPVFPPEDWAAQRRLGALGLPIAAGENACTAQEFGHLAQAVRYVQPSVTKVGGVSEFLRVATLARQRQGPDHEGDFMAHSPYFGPGYHATLQLAAALDNFGLFEHLYIDPLAWAGGHGLRPESGHIAIPDRPGIGFEPDADVLHRYAAP